MAHEDLKRELQAIDMGQYATALSNVLLRQNDPAEALNMLKSFSEEYSALNLGGVVITEYGKRTDATQGEQTHMVSGFLAGLIALKEMIDTAQLNSIPTSE